jgi:hypothetical protein
VDAVVALASTYIVTCYVPAVFAQLNMAGHYCEKEFFRRRTLWEMQREHFFLCLHEIEANAASGKGNQDTGEHRFLVWCYC